jgi:hypothetical protein
MLNSMPWILLVKTVKARDFASRVIGFIFENNHG